MTGRRGDDVAGLARVDAGGQVVGGQGAPQVRGSAVEGGDLARQLGPDLRPSRSRIQAQDVRVSRSAIHTAPQPVARPPPPPPPPAPPPAPGETHGRRGGPPGGPPAVTVDISPPARSVAVASP